MRYETIDLAMQKLEKELDEYLKDPNIINLIMLSNEGKADEIRNLSRREVAERLVSGYLESVIHRVKKKYSIKSLHQTICSLISDASHYD